MRFTSESISPRVALLACGLTVFAAACGGGGGGGGTGGARSDAGTGGKIDGGTGGSGGHADAGTGGAISDAGAGGRMDAAPEAGTGGAPADAGTGGSAADSGAGGFALTLPWHAFLPLASAAPGSATATGTTLDVTGNHYDATYFGPTIRFANAALNLTGAGSELVVVPAKAGVPAVDVTGSYSVSVWVTLTSIPGYQTIVSGEGVNIASFFLQKRDDSGAFAFTLPSADNIAAPGCGAPGPQTDGGPVQSPVIPVANTQYHLVATRDAVTNLAVLYVNGVESGRNTCVSGWADTGILGIGHGVFGTSRGDFVHGSIAEVGVINRVLTPAEVAALFAHGRTGGGGPDAGVDTGVDTGADVPVGTDAGPPADAAPDAPADAPADGG